MDGQLELSVESWVSAVEGLSGVPLYVKSYQTQNSLNKQSLIGASATVKVAMHQKSYDAAEVISKEASYSRKVLETKVLSFARVFNFADFQPFMKIF